MVVLQEVHNVLDSVYVYLSILHEYASGYSVMCGVVS